MTDVEKLPQATCVSQHSVFFFFPPRASGKRLEGTRAKFFSGVERGRPEERSERRGGLVADSGVQFKGLAGPRWKVFQLRKIPRGLPGPTCRGGWNSAGPPPREDTREGHFRRYAGVFKATNFRACLRVENARGSRERARLGRLGRQREILTPNVSLALTLAPPPAPPVAIPRITAALAAVFHASLTRCGTICIARLDPF